MNVSINAKGLRASLPDVVERVRKGTRFTVIYGSRPAFQIVPVNAAEQASAPVDEDSLYRAAAVGSSKDGRTRRTTMRCSTGDEGGLRRHGVDGLRRSCRSRSRGLLYRSRCDTQGRPHSDHD